MFNYIINIFKPQIISATPNLTSFPVKGIDYSKWQGIMNYDILLARDDVDFVIIRAGSIDSITGVCYEDFQFRRNAEFISKSNKVFGFYWYFRPQWSGALQAEFFYKIIKDYPWRIPPSPDCEESGGKSPSIVASAIWVMCNSLHLQSGKLAMPYTSPGFWNSYVAHNTWAKELPLWDANWEVVVPNLPIDWKGLKPKFWQHGVYPDAKEYGATASTSLDHDVYMGTREEFNKEFGTVQPTPPPPIWSHEEQHEILWREAGLHSWNLTK